MSQGMKMMFANIGYCRQFVGMPLDYVKNVIRFFTISKRMQREVIGDIYDLVVQQNPDIFFLAEVKAGWQEKQIIKQFSSAYPYYNFSLKYPVGSRLHLLPVLHRNEGKMFFSKERISSKVWHLNNGTETGVIEVKLENGLVILTAHFSLLESTRQLQYRNILEKCRHLPNVLLLGDFNHTGKDELKPFFDGGFRLAPCDGEFTFPSVKYRSALDEMLIENVFPSLRHRFIDLCLSNNGTNPRVSVNKKFRSDHRAITIVCTI